MIRITFPGIAVSKKNSRRIVKKKRAHISIPSTAYVVWNKRMTTIITAQYEGPPITFKINLQVVFFYTTENFDMSNHIASIEDTLQDAKILDDDRLVYGYDGSAKVYLCERCQYRKVVTKGPRKGQKETNCKAVRKCPFARILVRMTPYDETTQISYMIDELLGD